MIAASAFCFAIFFCSFLLISPVFSQVCGTKLHRCGLHGPEATLNTAANIVHLPAGSLGHAASIPLQWPLHMYQMIVGRTNRMCTISYIVGIPNNWCLLP